jgi:Mn-dependent DtxR family transcriptional regulator
MNVTRRHEVMRQFLVEVLEIDEATADAAACKLEHALSGVVLERLATFVQQARRCPSCLTAMREPRKASSHPHSRPQPQPQPQPRPRPRKRQVAPRTPEKQAE